MCRWLVLQMLYHFYNTFCNILCYWIAVWEMLEKIVLSAAMMSEGNEDDSNQFVLVIAKMCDSEQ